MKKKLIISIILIIIGTYLVYSYKKYQYLENLRYEEIETTVSTAIEKAIDATFVIHNDYNCKHYTSQTYRENDLINLGLLTRDDLLEYDELHHCKFYSKTKIDNECNITFDLYLNCHNRKDKGYKN